MGFYDPNRNRKSPSIFFISMISAIIGGLVVALVLTPVFFLTDFFADQSNHESTQQEEPSTKKKVNVNVNSNITSAVNKVHSAVVGIINLKNSGDPFNPEAIQQGTGSGIIFRKQNGKALIVTNYHVIANSTSVQVVIPYQKKSKTVTAKVLGTDEVTDLAVLEISDQYVTTVAEFGNSDNLQPGEPAIAIGNPLGFESSITVGVISSPKRSIKMSEFMTTDVIQTDAAINPGNSGGALVNVDGQVIGINSLKIAEKGIEGLGFAIPVNDALPIIESLIKFGKVPRPYLGVSLIDLKDLPPPVWHDTLRLPQTIEGGVVVRSVSFGTPADEAGLRPQDVIVALDKHPIRSSSDLRSYMYKNKKVGSKLTITFYRNGVKQTSTTTLTKAPNQLP